MLDFTISDPKMTEAWQDNILPGDILSFRFPLAEEGRTACPKARPCLVLEAEVRDGQRYVLLAYGTTSRRRSNIGYEIHARRKADYVSAGLHEPTRFVGKRRMWVPVDHGGFVISSTTGSAVLGSLDGNPRVAMDAVRARLHAEHDIRTAGWSLGRRPRAPKGISKAERVWLQDGLVGGKAVQA